MGHVGGFGIFARGRYLAVLAAALLLANCAGGDRIDPRYGVAASPRVVAPGEPVPKGGGVYRVGKPYVVAGRVYVPEADPHYTAVGYASWYGDAFHGRYTANGEIFDANAITAAHPTLPLPSYVRVTNLQNHKSIVVRVNDRGPYVGDRIIDLSIRTAKLLGFYGHGLAKVKVEYIGLAPLAGSDDRVLMSTLRENAPAPARPVLVAANGPARVPSLVARPRDVPVPPDRPFGREEDAAARAAEEEEAAPAAEAAPMPSGPVYRVAGAASAPVPSSPVSAFAATGNERPALDLLSGRGLY
ncbi:MAG: septal ring lytic transglycosylase RlpA family protein [Pseudolabrys sp.]|nr:septal ring lytic transglycosylase RlpA family protein [Pseudolabrys sp.]